MNRQPPSQIKLSRRQTLKLVLLLAFLPAILLETGACTPIQPPDASGPRANQPVYPVVLSEDTQRSEAALAAASQIIGQQGNKKIEVKLQPVTATIQSLAGPDLALYLSKIGEGPTMSEEETRESLRRFITGWRSVIGADPSQLSLIERIDQGDGTKLASYEQRPFRYPLRGEYGKLQIQFASDRRVLNVSSTCIPDSERVQSALAGVTPRVKAEDAMSQIRDSGFTYTDSAGTERTFKPAANTGIDARELVIYVLPSTSHTLEFHLAWAISLTNSPVKIVYLDAVDARVIAAA